MIFGEMLIPNMKKIIRNILRPLNLKSNSQITYESPLKTIALSCLYIFAFFLLNFLSGTYILANAPDGPEVIVYRTKAENWTDTIQALGTLRANETVVLTASVTDTITHIHFDDGQRVEQGFVLAQMTDDEESALVTEMTARVEEAKKQLERLKTLPKSGAVSKSLFDQREREYTAAKAQLEAMKSRLKDRLIIAPFAGVVGLRNISVGALVAPGDEITTLTDDSIMKLDFSVPAIFLPSLEKGLSVTAKTNAYPERIFSGTVSSVDSRVDTVTRAITVRALITNHDKMLKPGLLMNVALQYRPRNSLTIPEEAIIPSGETNSVFVVSEDKKIAEQRAVSIGGRKNGQVEITNGLSAGELVITHGTMAARNGKPVTIFPFQEDGEGIEEILKRKKA